jgi:hypothetical protein
VTERHPVRGHDASRRVSFVVGIDGPVPDVEQEAELDELALRRLTYAGEYADVLSAHLGKFGYEAPDTSQAMTCTATFESMLLDTLTGPGTVIVHVLAHSHKHDRTQKLHVIGGDGHVTSTHVEAWLEVVEGADDLQRPLVLFVLDLCYAGTPLVERWQAQLRAEQRNAWVIAACGEDMPSYDGRLTRALSEVLRRFAVGELRVDSTMSHIPIMRICREIKALIAEYEGNGPPQHVEYTNIALGDDLKRLTFFPNPRYETGDGDSLVPFSADPELRPLLEASCGVEHFLRALAGPAGRRVRFRGRAGALRVLSEWLDGSGPALRIVTGKPGAGKSTVISVAVCAAHERLRSVTAPMWEHLPHFPARVQDLAVIHARRRGLTEIADSLARQWELDSDPDAGAWTAARLVGAIQVRFPQRQPTLILDALDEADRAQDVAAALLLPLVTAVRDDGRPLCRILVGARNHEHLAPLFTRAYANDAVLDLNDTPPAELAGEIAAYVADTLRDREVYRREDMAPAVDALATGIAAALTDPPLPWGEFLVAGVYAEALVAQTPAREPHRAKALGLAVPRDLRTVLEFDLETRIRHPWAAAVLSALAFAQGPGMPEQVVLVSATAFAPRTPDLDEVRAALDAVRFYLQHDVDDEGNTCYRLFHEGFADELRREPLTHSFTDATGSAE